MKKNNKLFEVGDLVKRNGVVHEVMYVNSTYSNTYSKWKNYYNIKNVQTQQSLYNVLENSLSLHLKKEDIDRLDSIDNLDPTQQKWNTYENKMDMYYIFKDESYLNEAKQIMSELKGES